MGHVSPPVSAASHSRGFSAKKVLIKAIDSVGNASCDDGSGNLQNISTHILRAKGRAPEVGEWWYINRDLGSWMFAAILGYTPNEGIATLPSGATTIGVILPSSEPDTNYGVLLTGTHNSTFWYGGVTTSGFTIHAGTAPGSNVAVAWKLVR